MQPWFDSSFPDPPAIHPSQALLHGKCTQITLAYCAPNPYSYEGMLGVLESLGECLPGFNVKTEVHGGKGFITARWPERFHHRRLSEWALIGLRLHGKLFLS